MGEVKHDGWSGGEALHQLSGLSSDALPVRVMFLAHRVAGSGRLWMTQGVNIRSVDFSGGLIVGCSGYTSLIAAVDGERGWSFTDWIAAASDCSDVEDDPVMAVAIAICREVIQVEDDGDWMVNFVASGPSDAESEGPGADALVALQSAIRETVSELSVREWLEGIAGSGFSACPPVDCDEQRWQLDARTRDLYHAASKATSVGALFVSVGTDGWGELGVLWRLGLLRSAVSEAVDSGASSTDVVPPPSEEGPTDAPQHGATAREDAPLRSAEGSETSTSKPHQASQEGSIDLDPFADLDSEEIGSQDIQAESVSTTDSTTDQSEQAKGKTAAGRPTTAPKSARTADSEKRTGRTKRDPKTGRKKRRRDPRLVAILRSPYENPAKMEVYLREAYDVLTRMRPEALFRIKKSEDLDSEKIERRYLDACSKYHPDRYRGASQGVQSLAEGCFTAVSDAYHKLQDETYMADLRIRIVEKETGQRVVTDKTRAAAKLEFAKADVLFKQKRYEAAFELASRAVEGDPDRWQYQYLKWRLAYRTGTAEVDVVRDEIGRLTGMTSIEKAASLCAVGEMYMREGQETKAYELFRQTLMLDAKNVGARRRMRLKDRREQDTNEREATGLFSGLFQRKKR